MITLRDLTPGEKLVLWRRREGLTNREAAARLSLPFSRYRRMEYGELPDEVPTPRLRALEPHEGCYITRRRAGLTQQDLAARLGLSRYWVLLMEQGREPCDQLTAYWEHQPTETA